jgi:hypothetical protein
MFGIQPHTPKEAQKEKTKQNPTISNGYSHTIVFLAQKIQKKKGGEGGGYKSHTCSLHGLHNKFSFSLTLSRCVASSSRDEERKGLAKKVAH